MKRTVLHIFCSICFFYTSSSVAHVKPSGWVDKGMTLVMECKYDEAIKTFDKAIELNPRDAVAYSNRGAAYGQIGNYKQQFEDSNRAIELNARDAVAYNNRGVAHGDGQL